MPLPLPLMEGGGGGGGLRSCLGHLGKPLGARGSAARSHRSIRRSGMDWWVSGGRAGADRGRQEAPKGTRERARRARQAAAGLDRGLQCRTASARERWCAIHGRKRRGRQKNDATPHNAAHHHGDLRVCCCAQLSLSGRFREDPGSI